MREAPNYLEKHNKLVVEIAEEVKKSRRIKFKSNDSFCLRRKPNDDINTTHIDITQLNDVLELNVEKKYVVVEPSVTMEQLYDITSKFNLTIPVISEMKHMTIGGAVIGLWGESSSFNYGLIDETVLEFEAILGNGEIINVSEKENPDLFMGLPGSCGSICMVTKLKIALVAMKPFIELTYQLFDSVDTYTKTIKQLKNVDFVESVCFNKNSILMMVGKYTSTYEEPLIDLHGKYCSTYAAHIHKLLNNLKNNSYREYSRTKDYFFRWDKGAFFVTYKKYGDNPFIKYLLGNKINSKKLYKLAQLKLQNNNNQSKIFQDVGISIDKFSYILEWLDKNVGIYPLWILPITKKQDNKLFSYQGEKNKILINIGIYGRINKIDNLSKLETIIHSIGGTKCLYGKNMYSEETFWNIYDKKKYDDLKNKYHTLNKFADIYKKIHDTSINVNSPNSELKGFCYLYEKIKDLFYLLLH